jgi:hypothetical protein
LYRNALSSRPRFSKVTNPSSSSSDFRAASLIVQPSLFNLFNLPSRFEYFPDLRQERDIVLTEPPMKGRKPNITALHGELDKAPPAPAWLPKFVKTEWDASYLRS